MDSTTERIRALCLRLPEATERPSHGSPAFFVRGRKQFVMLWPEGHHDDDFPQLWCAAPPGAQAELIAADPARFFRPPYVGHRGWLGVRLDRDPDWSEIAELCQDAFRTVAPKTLVTRLDGATPGFSAEARRLRQHEAAQAYGELLRGRAPEEAETDRMLSETSNDIALRDTER